MSLFKSNILVMTVTIHYPKCKYCHLIFLLERTLLRGMHFSLDGHLLLLSLIEREGEGSREGEIKKGRETNKSILFCCLLARPLHNKSQRW